MNNDVRLFFYVGISGSGKTYKAYEIHGEDAVIIDSDQTREKLLGSADRQDQNARVFEHMWRETCECIERGVSVCYVATNLSARRRISFLKNLHHRFPSLDCTCYIINTPIDTCYKRNATRERHVPDYVIGRQLQSFQIPCEAEGWNRIEVVDNYEEGRDALDCLIEVEEKVRNFGSQNNSHHIYTLAKHGFACGNAAMKKKFNKFIIQACYIHDYGKIYTATRWEKDDYKEVHYPGHASVSGYLALNMGFSLYVAQLVNAHMYPYTNEREQEVWRVRFGEKLWEDVLKLHECDCEAH